MDASTASATGPLLGGNRMPPTVSDTAKTRSRPAAARLGWTLVRISNISDLKFMTLGGHVAGFTSDCYARSECCIIPSWSPVIAL